MSLSNFYSYKQSSSGHLPSCVSGLKFSLGDSWDSTPLYFCMPRALSTNCPLSINTRVKHQRAIPRMMLPKCLLPHVQTASSWESVLKYQKAGRLLLLAVPKPVFLLNWNLSFSIRSFCYGILSKWRDFMKYVCRCGKQNKEQIFQSSVF